MNQDTIAAVTHGHRAVGVLRLVPDSLTVHANPTLCGLLDYTPDDMEGMPFEQLVAADQYGAVRLCLVGLDRDPLAAQSMEIAFVSRRGARLSLRTMASWAADAGGAHFLLYVEPPLPPGMAGRRCVARAFKDIYAGVLLTDAGLNIIAVNDAFSRMTGYREEEVLGRSPRLLQSGRHSAGFYRRMWQSIRRNGYWHGEIWNRRHNGDIYPERLSISVMRDGDGRVENYLGVFYDISDEISQREELDKLAHSDPLTGLLNRHAFIRRAEYALIAARRGSRRLALLFIDLDNFKDVNDRRGHSVGDQVLREMGERLGRCVRQNDCVARWGGDEFVALLTEGVNAAGVRTVAEKISQALSEPFVIDGMSFRLTVSIGIGMYPEHALTSAELIEKADKAMYGVKWSGRNGYAFAE